MLAPYFSSNISAGKFQHSEMTGIHVDNNAADSVVYAHVQLTGLISDCFFLWQHVFCPEINHHNRLFYNLLAGFDPMRVT